MPLRDVLLGKGHATEHHAFRPKSSTARVMIAGEIDKSTAAMLIVATLHDRQDTTDATGRTRS